MLKFVRLLLSWCLLATPLLVFGCQPAEEGPAAEETMEEVGDEMEEAGEAMEFGGDDMAEDAEMPPDDGP